MIKPRTMKGPFPDRSPWGDIGCSGSPLAYLIDPGAGSASDRVQRNWPDHHHLEDISRRGGDITPLYPAVDEYHYPIGDFSTGRTPSDKPNIPRTRAEIIGYKHRVPFGGVSVWSSHDKASVPIWEDTAPYTKLPTELLNKSFYAITSAEVLLYARAADRPDHDLDQMIWYKFIYDPILAQGGDALTKVVDTKNVRYTHSLDAACTLFLMKPTMIPTDVLDVVVMALEQRLDPDMVKFVKKTK